MPPSVEDWVGPGHPARFVREFVAALDLKALGLDTLKRDEGGVTHEPALLLSVWLYGYMRRLRSTRALERACLDDIGFIWLSGNHRPDHNALWRFWDRHHEGLRALFRRSVKVAFELKLLGLVTQALDGTKIQAACSGRGGFDRAHLEKLLAGSTPSWANARPRSRAPASTPSPPVCPPSCSVRKPCASRCARPWSGW